MFNSIIHTYFRLFTLSQKKTNCYSLIYHVWKNVTARPCKMHTFFIFFFHFFTRMEYKSAIGRVAEALRHGLNFSTAWWTMQLISSEKDWKHAFLQKVVSLNICCNVACLTSHLPQITTGFFQSHQHLKESNIASVRWKSCAFYKIVWWHFSSVVGKGVTFVFFWDNVNNLKYVWIILLKWFFWISHGKVATVYRWGGQLYKLLMSNFLRI